MDCVHHPGVDAPYQCFRCREFICVDCETKVEGRSYCRSCFANIHHRLAGQYASETRNINFPLAVVSGVIAAGLTAVLWSQAVSYLPFTGHIWPALLGGAVGWAIVSGTGGKRGEKLQRLAVILTLVGVIAGFFLVSYHLETFRDLGATQFDSPVSAALSTFPAYLMQKAGPLAWLFVLVGLGWAWYVPHERSVPD